MLDKPPADWPKPLAEVYGDVWSDPAAWARRVKELGADLVNLRLVSTHPDEGDRSPQTGRRDGQGGAGRGRPAADHLGLRRAGQGPDGHAQGGRGRPGRELPAWARSPRREYRTLAAAAQAYGHKLIALAPVRHQQVEAGEHPRQRHGLSADRHRDLPDHRLAGLRHGVRLLDSGAWMNDFLSKPVDPDVLFAKVLKWLKGNQPRLTNRQCADRAGGDAGAATGAFFRINFRQWAAAQAWRKADGTGVAKVAANPAFDAFGGQAGRADQGSGKTTALARHWCGARPVVCRRSGSRRRRCIHHGQNPRSESRRRQQ